jgi:transposase
MLRTNLQAGSADELWSEYMQLTEAEAAFRTLKSELYIRPLFHQLEPRVKAHVLVAFLGYALWVTLKHLLQRRAPILPKPSASGVYNAQPLSPMKVSGMAFESAERRHCSAHYRRPRNSAAPYR